MWKFDVDAPVQFAVAEIHDVHVREEMTAFQRLADCAERHADEYSWTPLAEIPDVQNARRFFRAIGVDPTKRRPSSEALLHRALKRKELYAINVLVDVGNWCSLELLLPTCIYDLDKVRGDVVVRLGRQGESYLALNNREIDFSGRFVLADDLGPFGSPMTDSRRTAVTRTTTNAALGIWAPGDYDAKKLRRHIDLFAQRVIEYCGGVLRHVQLLSG